MKRWRAWTARSIGSSMASAVLVPSLWILIPLVLGLGATVANGQDPTPASIVELENKIEQLRHEVAALKASPTDTTLTELQFEDVPICNDVQDTNAQEAQYPIVRLTGFFQADAVWFDQDAGNIAAVGDIQDGADFRRTRLAAVGDVWENVGYIVEMDFSAGGRPSFMDVWGEIRQGFHGNNLRIGQFRQPFGMDGQTSIRDLVFMERATPFLFLPFRQIGVMTYGTNANQDMTWHLSGFRYPTDAYGGNVGDYGGYGLASRLTALLAESPSGVLHSGAGYCFVDPSANFLRLRNQPEIFVVETGTLGPILGGIPTDVPAFVDTGNMIVENMHLANAELGITHGPFYAQSEVFYAVVNQSYFTDLCFSGAYAQASYALTGESHAYNHQNGVFERIVPRTPYSFSDGIGAWELAARWSYVDLIDDNIQGGRLNNVTLGLNWYLNRRTKFQFNYIHAMLGSSPAVDGPIVANSNADVWACRLQIDF